MRTLSHCFLFITVNCGFVCYIYFDKVNENKTAKLLPFLYGIRADLNFLAVPLHFFFVCQTCLKSRQNLHLPPTISQTTLQSKLKLQTLIPILFRSLLFALMVIIFYGGLNMFECIFEGQGKLATLLEIRRHQHQRTRHMQHETQRTRWL